MDNYVFEDGGVFIKNLSNEASRHGISQYRFPHNYELAGSDFTISDGTSSHRLNFVRREYLELDGKEYDYEALKIGPDVYFVRIGFNAAVADIAQGLITIVFKDSYFYGKIDGFSTDGASHTDDPDALTETGVAWVLGCGRYVSHEFTEAGKVRVRWSPIDEAFNDLPCKITKINESIFLVDVTGRVPYHTDAPVLTERYAALCDFDRMMTAGCIMGGGETPVMVSGYARFLGEANTINIPGGNQLNLDTGEFV